MSNLTKDAFIEEIEYIMYRYEINGIPRHRLLKTMYSHITSPDTEATPADAQPRADRLQ
jgi:hypothetical protein